MVQTNFTLKELQKKQGTSEAKKVFTLDELQEKQDVASKMKMSRLRKEAEIAETEAIKAASPLGLTKEFGREFRRRIGEVTGITPTAKRIAAGIAPLVVPEEELPDVVEELVGGVTTPAPSKGREFLEIAADLPVVSLGLSKSIAKFLGEQGVKVAPEALGKFLSKELSDFLPEVFKKEVSIKGIKETVEEIPSKIKAIPSGIEARGVGKELIEIEDLISPGLTSKEVRKVSSEQRLIRGKKGGFREKLFGEKDDIIIQEDSVKQASRTINERIPNASKLNDQELLGSLKKEVTTISNEIKPEMQNIQVKPEKIKQVFDTWEILKKKQAKDIGDFKSFNGASMQARFEEFLNQMKQPIKGVEGKFRQKNLDDSWNIRKEYDNSIPSRVKEATGQSEGRLQFQKETWLDNRAILNDMINDTSEGLGSISRKAFSDMTDLYQAQQNIISKTKLAKPQAGLISQKNLLRLGGIWIGGSIIQSVTGIDIPGI